MPSKLIGTTKVTHVVLPISALAKYASACVAADSAPKTCVRWLEIPEPPCFAAKEGWEHLSQTLLAPFGRRFEVTSHVNILTYTKLWVAESSLHRITLELAAARDYLDATVRAYEHEGYSRDDLVADILDVRAHVAELGEEHSYVCSYIERLKNESRS